MSESNSEATEAAVQREARLTQERALVVVLAVVSLLLLKLILRERGSEEGGIAEEVIEDLVKVVEST